MSQWSPDALESDILTVSPDDTEKQKREADDQKIRAQEQEMIQENLRASLKQEYERFEREAKEDRKWFHKEAKRGGNSSSTF